MSKPEGALELPTPSDLTESAVAWARETLETRIRQRYDPPLRHTYWWLEVPSQIAERALLMTASDDSMSVSLNCRYDPDEWSLHMHGFDSDTDGLVGYCVWSPGA